MKFFLIFIFTSVFCFSQNELKLNNESPKINISDWIENVPLNKSINNKYIVLEFWATWCSPCLKAVPHLNDLQNKFSQDNLLFISITDEEVSKVKKLLELVKFNSIVVSDLTKTTQKNFGNKNKGLEELPLTVLIDNKNIIKWIGKPKELNEEIIVSFLNNENIINKTIKNFETKNNFKTNFDTFLEIASNKDLIYFFKIEKQKDLISYNETNNNKINKSLFYLQLVDLKDIFINTLDYNENLISFDSLILKNRYDFIYKNTNFNSETISTIENSILNTLNLKKLIITKKLKSNNIIHNNKFINKSNSHESSIIFYESKALLFSYTLEMLSDFLNKNSNQLFHYDGNNSIKYDFTIDIKDFDSIVNSLNKQFLELKNEEKKYNYYILEEK